MPFKRFFDDQAAIVPEQLDLLQGVFDSLCRAGNLEPRSPEAENLAATLIGVYQAGFRSREELLHMLTAQGIHVE